MICGIDEAGRGPFAGPMVIAGAVLHSHIEGLGDSKKISEKNREKLFEKIIKNSSYKIVFKTHNDIDKFGLSLCLKQSIEEIKTSLNATRYIMDGNTNFGIEGVEYLVRGDSKEPSISAGSILAKVSRDRYMCNLPSKYDKYLFCKHKGYGTALHKELIREYGFSDIHRKSFKISL